MTVKRKTHNAGFTMIELLITLALMAMIFLAVGSAFDAAFTNYEVNSEYNSVNMSHRNIIHQITAAVRTAWNDPDEAEITVTMDGNSLSLTDSTGREILYRYEPDLASLLVSIDGGDEYLMLENVEPVDAGTDIFRLEDPPVGSGFVEGTVGKVIISFRVSSNGMSKVISTAAIPRNILYD